LESDHGSDVVWFLEIVPSRRKESRGDFAKQHGDIMDQNKENDTSNDAVCDVV
jgi:hypothetical protein